MRLFSPKDRPCSAVFGSVESHHLVPFTGFDPQTALSTPGCSSYLPHPPTESTAAAAAATTAKTVAAAVCLNGN